MSRGKKGKAALTIIVILASLQLLLSLGLVRETLVQDWTKTPDEWADHIIASHHIIPRKNYSRLMLALDFPIEKSEYYLALQKKIATIIPEEANRPIIDLQLYGKNAVNTFGIVGGVGPLSDAELLHRLIRDWKGSLDHVRINLLSSPPPRKPLDLFLNGSFYLIHLHQFLRRNHTHIVIASNTAHIHFDVIRFLSKGNLFNLAHTVADQLKDKGAVLILGTTRAQRAELYPKLLRERNIAYATLSEEEQIFLQHQIEKTKQQLLDDDGRGLYAFVEKLIAEKKPKVILLACTELSMALKNQIEKLQQSVQIIDTEEVFCREIRKQIGQSL